MPTWRRRSIVVQLGDTCSPPRTRKSGHAGGPAVASSELSVITAPTALHVSERKRVASRSSPPAGSSVTSDRRSPTTIRREVPRYLESRARRAEPCKFRMGVCDPFAAQTCLERQAGQPRPARGRRPTEPRFVRSPQEGASEPGAPFRVGRRHMTGLDSQADVLCQLPGEIASVGLGLRPVAAYRHLTTAGTGWSAFGPRTGKPRKPSPGGGRGTHQNDL
jgi:hypothetical protein